MQRTTWTPQASENIEVIIHILHKDGTREYERTGNRIIIPLREPGLAKNDRLMLPFWIYRAIKTHIQRNESLRRLVYGEDYPETSAVQGDNNVDISSEPCLPTLFDCIEIRELPHNNLSSVERRATMRAEDENLKEVPHKYVELRIRKRTDAVVAGLRMLLWALQYSSFTLWICGHKIEKGKKIREQKLSEPLC